MATLSKKAALPDLDLSLLNVKQEDSLSLKLLMLIEGIYGLGPKHSYTKYGYSEQRYYQLLKSFQQYGAHGLADKKRGPRHKHVRVDKIVQQIIRYRFLDPESPASVISQKLNQLGYRISIRSVERTIQEFGLQKKTLSVKSRKRGESRHRPKDQEGKMPGFRDGAKQ